MKFLSSLIMIFIADKILEEYKFSMQLFALISAVTKINKANFLCQITAFKSLMSQC